MRPVGTQNFGLFQYPPGGFGLEVGWEAVLLQHAADQDSDLGASGFADGPVRLRRFVGHG